MGSCTSPLSLTFSSSCPRQPCLCSLQHGDLRCTAHTISPVSSSPCNTLVSNRLLPACACMYRVCTHCRFWIKIKESTILLVERLLGAWARQSSGTRCRQRAEVHDERRTPCEAPLSAAWKWSSCRNASTSTSRQTRPVAPIETGSMITNRECSTKIRDAISIAGVPTTVA